MAVFGGISQLKPFNLASCYFTASVALAGLYNVAAYFMTNFILRIICQSHSVRSVITAHNLTPAKCDVISDRYYGSRSSELLGGYNIMHTYWVESNADGQSSSIK